MVIVNDEQRLLTIYKTKTKENIEELPINMDIYLQLPTLTVWVSVSFSPFYF